MLWPWLTRCRCADVTNLSNVYWCNVTPSFDLPRHRRSIQLGPGGHIGLTEVSGSSLYPAAETLSDTDSLPDDEFSGNHTWGPINQGTVEHAYRVTEGWRRTIPRLSYKMLTEAGDWFLTGMYEFAQMPFIYEVVRRMLTNSLEDSHLPAPDWLLEEWFFWFCPNIKWRNSHQSFYKHSP